MCTTLITAAAVSVCGIVGWVGLVIPHLCRMMVGPDHRVLLPATFSIGATYLLCHRRCRAHGQAGEIPLGILTAHRRSPVFRLSAAQDPGHLAMNGEPGPGRRIPSIGRAGRGGSRRGVQLRQAVDIPSTRSRCPPRRGADRSGPEWLREKHVASMHRRCADARAGRRADSAASELASLDPAARARKIGFLFQDHTPSFPFTVLDVAVMGRTPHLGLFGAPSSKDTELAIEALGQVGMPPPEGRPYTDLSGGERQLVLLSRTLGAAAGDHFAR